jgi:hypothetical protein
MNHREPKQRNLAGVTNVLQKFDVEPSEDETDSPLRFTFLRLRYDRPS